MNVDAYSGLADAYIGMSDVEAALDALKRGYELTEDESLQVKIREVEEISLKIWDWESSYGSAQVRINDMGEQIIFSTLIILRQNMVNVSIGSSKS